MHTGVPSYRQRYLQIFPPLFVVGLCVWALINVAQSLLTEIGHDEAYYWMYSRFLAFGYFDHPPMIALFIHVGHALLEGELATRSVTILAQVFTLMVMWKLIITGSPSRRQVIFFFGTAASVVMFQVYGFIATPDSPLLLFTALFLWAWQNFLSHRRMIHVAALAITMAGLMYSKYHGALVITFTLMAYPRMLLLARFWLAAISALLLFTPHLLWQFHHDFPSFQYHLVSRSRPFNIKHVLNYVPNQLLTFNPLFLGALFFVLFRFPARDVFERSLRWIIFGFLGFFFLSTVRGHVEPHWTIAASIPMIILINRHGAGHERMQRFARRFLFPSILIIVFVRLALMIDFLPVNTRFHGEKAWAEHLAKITGDMPVVFRNSYQRPSIFMYYTGQTATALNSLYYRHTQYDIWPFEEQLAGQKVVLVTQVNDPWSVRYEFPRGKKEYLHVMPQFFSVQKIRVDFDLKGNEVMRVGDTIRLPGVISNPYPYAVHFDDPVFPVIFNTTFIKSGNDMTVTPFQVSPVISALRPGEQQQVLMEFVVPDVCPRLYTFGITLQAGIIQEAYNSAVWKVNVKVAPPVY